MKKIRWLISLPVALILVVFAINNRNLGDVSLWPFDLVGRAPVFLIVFLGLLVGFFIGAFIVWSSRPFKRRPDKVGKKHFSKEKSLSRRSNKSLDKKEEIVTKSHDLQI